MPPLETPFGNRLTTVTADTLSGAINQASRTERSMVYTPNAGRLLGYAPSPAPPAFTYDGSGDQIFEQTGSGAQVVNRASYYDAAGQLRAVDARTQGSFAVGSTAYVFEQYRYDALGRRVWVRTDRRCDASLVGQNAPVCDQSTLRRVVWDGDQILAEVQVPVKLTASSTELPASDQDNDLYLPRLVPYANGKDPNPFFGRVLYTHGLALDQPLAITRLGYVDNFQGSASTHIDFAPQTIALFWTAQGYLGNAGCGTGSAGQQCRATHPTTGRVANMAVGITALHFAYERPRTDTLFFQGSLLRDQRDATGTLYRRNRTYDPGSGRFTQEDPIGLAGGLNRYGFADGDPVNFADPFGLCPVCLVAYGIFEGASAAYDLYETYRAYQRSPSEGAYALSAAFVGAIAPGPGNAYLKGGRYVEDFVTKSTRNFSAQFGSEGAARNLARTKLGKDAVDVSAGKLRSIDGKWQYRAKPGDVSQNHVHLEQLNPKTGEVLQNWHLK
jgi:RHS repeat-associated protein